MGFFSGILKKAAPVIGGALGNLVLPGVGGVIGGGLGKMIGGNAEAIGTGIGEGVSDWMSANSAQDAANIQNDQNWARTQAQNAFNAAEAEKNRQFGREQQNYAEMFNSREAGYARDFEERMSNTQYQRAVGDMQAAGINPMLAVSQGGAGNVSSSAASVGAAGGGQASAANFQGIVSALDVSSQLKQRDAQTELLHAQADSARTEAEVNSAIKLNRIKRYGYETSNVEQQGYLLEENLRKLRAEATGAEQQIVINGFTAKLREIETRYREKEVTGKQYQNELDKLELDVQRAFKKDFEKWSNDPQMGPYISGAGALGVMLKALGIGR